jgi:hypothetical protein
MRCAGRSDRRYAVMVVTIFAIAGTLFSCGRYGSPVRVGAVEGATEQPAPEDEVVGVPTSEVQDEEESLEEQPDRSSKP